MGIAKEAADIALLEKDLDILMEGVKLGRTTFANTLKYVFIATSANFRKEAKDLLDKANFDYELHYWPEQVAFYTVPISESPFGAHRGIREIREVVTSRLARQFVKI